MSLPTRLCAVSLGVLLAVPLCTRAGSFVFSDVHGVGVITHPANTTFQPGNATPAITVCVDPSAQPLSGNPEQSIRNAIATFNRLQPMQANVRNAADAGVPPARPDFETVFLHELGHCLGLDHTVLGPSADEANCTLGSAGTCKDSPSVYATIATRGDGVFNVAAGADGMRASRDDIRGNDVNRHWYERGVNDPFRLPPGIVDRNTYAVTTSHLPLGHTFVEAATSHAPCSNPTSNTAGLPGRVPLTQNAMFPVVCTSNVLRELAPDDVGTLRIARSGRDGTQGSADDYAPVISYIGVTSNCDVRLRFSGGGIGVCEVTGNQSDMNTFVIGSGVITVGQTNIVNWHFNQTDTATEASSDLSVTMLVVPASPGRGDVLTYSITASNAGPDPAEQVVLAHTLPPDVLLQEATGPGWTCTGDSPITCERDALANGASSTITVLAEIPADYAGTTQLQSTATIDASTGDPSNANNTASATVQLSLLADRIFGDGFE